MFHMVLSLMLFFFPILGTYVCADHDLISNACFLRCWIQITEHYSVICWIYIISNAFYWFPLWLIFASQLWNKILLYHFLGMMLIMNLVSRGVRAVVGQSLKEVTYMARDFCLLAKKLYSVLFLDFSF